MLWDFRPGRWYVDARVKALVEKADSVGMGRLIVWSVGWEKHEECPGCMLSIRVRVARDTWWCPRCETVEVVYGRRRQGSKAEGRNGSSPVRAHLDGAPSERA